MYVATEHDSVYAIDADNGVVLWHTSFITPPNVIPVPAEDIDDGADTDIAPEIGITGTPVIDSGAGTLFVVAKTKEGGTNYVQRLHALDITSGREKLGGPVVIQASVPGTGDASVGGTVRFDALRELQREALLLANGSVYVAFASLGDIDPYHGWLLGYSASNLKPTLVYNSTPNGSEGGIWQSGAGPGIDNTGNIFFVSGNGAFDANTGGSDFGQSFVKLSPQGKVLDFFTPLDQETLNGPDFDVGSAGLLLLPDQSGGHTHLELSGTKNNTIYLVDRDHMGHFDPNNNNIVQTLPEVFPAGDPQGLFTAPVLWNNTVYFGAVGDTITAFSLSNGMLSSAPVMRSATSFAYPGAALAISAHGSTAGIVWAIENTTDSGDQTNAVLHAYDASTMNELCTIQLPDAAVKFASPTIANGKVYVAGQSTLTMLSSQ